MESIYDNDFATIYYDDATKVIYAKYEGLYDYEKHIEAFRNMMEFTKENNIVGTLHDFMDLKGTFTKANSFVKKEFIPHMEEYGMRYAALGMSSDVFTRFALNQLLKLGKMEHSVQICKGSKEAREWLEKKMNITLDIPGIPE